MQISIPKGAIMRPWARYCRAIQRSISIPKGAIMSCCRLAFCMLQRLFQFQKVRLWANECFIYPKQQLDFNSKRCDYENKIAITTIATMQFQFQKVRLWASAKFCTNCDAAYFNSKRCDYESPSAIRSTTSISDFNSKRCDYEFTIKLISIINRQISIPKGAIMRLARKTKPMPNTISIPKGAIMSQAQRCRAHRQNKFQFQKVRLWAGHLQTYICVHWDFNSKRCDYEPSIVFELHEFFDFNSKRCDYEAPTMPPCTTTNSNFNSKRCDYELI